MKILKQSIKSVLLVIILIFIVATGLGRPTEGLYAAIILFIPLTIVSMTSIILMNYIFSRLNIVKKFDRIFLTISLSIIVFSVYLGGNLLMFDDLIEAFKDSWFIMITITTMVTINVIETTEKANKKKN